MNMRKNGKNRPKTESKSFSIISECYLEKLDFQGCFCLFLATVATARKGNGNTVDPCWQRIATVATVATAKFTYI
jgi:hypothetical protein